MLSPKRESIVNTANATTFNAAGNDNSKNDFFIRNRKKILVCVTLFLLIGMVAGVVAAFTSTKSSPAKTQAASPLSVNRVPTMPPNCDDTSNKITANNGENSNQTQLDNDTNNIVSSGSNLKMFSLAVKTAAPGGSSSNSQATQATTKTSTSQTTNNVRGSQTHSSNSGGSSNIGSSSQNAGSYKDIQFDWNNPSSWEWADGSDCTDAASKFTSNGFTVDTSVRKTSLRTKTGWRGEKVVYFSWINNQASDTNIWMLNTKIQSQYTANNGWPYYGELDMFEMFTQDAKDKPSYDFSGFGSFSNVASYGQLTLHMSTSVSSSTPCFCPSSPSKSTWYQNAPSSTSACTAQFANTPNTLNEMAMIFGKDSNGFYLQIIQYPKLIQGSGNTYDVKPGSNSVVGEKIYNNENTYWGAPISQCNSAGNNPSTGFPFFEEFRLIVEEQDKSGSGHFILKDVKILLKN